mgnify:CR=1 FL=1
MAPTLWFIESTYLKPAEELADVTPLHRSWLDQHYKSGTFITSGRKADGTGGIIFAVADDEESLRELFSEDPFVKEGCSEYRYVPFTPVKRGKALHLDGVPLVE